MADLIDDVLDYARLGGTLKVPEVDLDFVLARSSRTCPRSWPT